MFLIEIKALQLTGDGESQKDFILIVIIIIISKITLKIISFFAAKMVSDTVTPSEFLSNTVTKKGDFQGL